MNKKRMILIASIFMIIILIGGFYFIQQPYRLKKELPHISGSDVEMIIIDCFNDEEKAEEYQGDYTIITNWLNEAKELKKDIGTTSDIKVTIYLTNNRMIMIWNMYSDDIVTVGYKEEDYYYQSNVRSEELAGFLKNIE